MLNVEEMIPPLPTGSSIQNPKLKIQNLFPPAHFAFFRRISPSQRSDAGDLHRHSFAKTEAVLPQKGWGSLAERAGQREAKDPPKRRLTGCSWTSLSPRFDCRLGEAALPQTAMRRDSGRGEADHALPFSHSR